MKFHQVKLWDAAKWEATPLLILGLACTSIPAVSSTQSTRRKVRPCSEGSYDISHLKWCPWGVSLKLRRGGVINLGTPGRKCKQPTWFFSALPSLKCLTISLTRKIYLVGLIFLAVTFSFPELLQVSSDYQNDNHWSLKMPPTVTMQWWKRKKWHWGASHNIDPRWNVCLFSVEDAESWQRKNKAPLYQNTSWRWFPSPLPLCQLHTNPEQPWAPGVFMVRLSHKHAILQNNTQSHPNIKQTR